MYKSILLKLLLALGLITSFYVMPLSPACAGAQPACDPAFMETLRQRGWREAQREIMMNESFIYKPDSVFALSCFSDALNRVPNSFTAGNATVPTATALSTYMGGNFNHNTLGGGAGSQNTNNCGLMRSVWVSAKCSNVTDAAFNNYTFANLASAEPRTNNPQTCGSGGAPSNPTTTWNNTNTRMTTIGAGASFDNANLFLNITDPFAALSASSRCSPGILTGVRIANRYDEKVCPNPGCVPVLSGSSLKCCDQNNTSNSNRCEP